MDSIILMYHRISDQGSEAKNLHSVSVDDFKEQMSFLKKAGLPVLPWRQMLEGRCPRESSIGITFDDGNKSDLGCAEILRALNYSALFFIPTQHIGKARYLNYDEVRELNRLGMGIGSHSHHHVRLAPLEISQAEEEMKRSKEILEGVVQTPVECFSFPGGSYNSKLLDIGVKLGYKCFFTSDWGVNGYEQFSKQVFSRIPVLSTVNIAEFRGIVGRRHFYARRLQFHSKEMIKKLLGDSCYIKIRRAFTSLHI